MGLDMWLTAERYIYGNEAAVKESIKNAFPTLGLEPKTVSFEVMYWRKANAIHKWFVDNCQDGIDECQTTNVDLDKLKELLAVINEVLEHTKMKDGKVCNGYEFKDGEMVPIMEDGQIAEDTTVAEELLPTTSGFFFGGTDYDNYYFEDLKRTKEELEKLFKLIEEKDEYKNLEFYYHSSW